MRLTARTFWTLWLVASCLAASAVAATVWVRSTTPQPITRSTDAAYFHVVGFTKQGKPMLLLHERSTARNSGSVLTAAQNKPGGPYSFYIAKARRAAVQKSLTDAIGDRLQSVTLTISEDDPRAKTQLVKVDYWADDFNWYSIYRVGRGKVTPVAYYDVVKRDGALAVFSGIGAFIVMVLAGLTVRGACSQTAPDCRRNPR